MRSRSFTAAAIAAGLIASGTAGFFLARRGEVERTAKALAAALEKSGHRTMPPGARKGETTTSAKGGISGGGATIGSVPSTPQELAATARDLLDIGDLFERNRRLTALLESLPMNKAQEFLRELGGITGNDDDLKSTGVMAVAVAWLGQRDPEGTMASLQAVGGTTGNLDVQTLRFFLPGLVARDIGAARDFYDSLCQGRLAEHDDDRAAVAATLALEWERRDAAGALAWVHRLPESERESALAALAARGGGRDPVAAIQLMEEITDDETRYGAAAKLATNWGLRDPASAMAWLVTQPQDVRDQGSHDVLRDWAVRDATAAAAWADAFPLDERESLLAPVIEGWARRDPAAAAQWFSGHSGMQEDVAALGEIMTNWLATDGKAATEWLGRQAPGPAKDGGIALVAKHEMQNDPAASLTWLTAISDEGRRIEEVSAGFQRWRDNDGDAADHWLATATGLTDEQRQTVLHSEPPLQSVDAFIRRALSGLRRVPAGE